MLDLYARRFEGRRLQPGRVRDLRRREVPAAGACRRHATLAGRSGPRCAGRVRVPAQRHARLPGRLGCPPRQDLRPLRGQDRHRAVRPARRPRHDHRALRLGRTVFWIVDNGSSHAGQPRSTGSRTPRQPAPDPPADPRLLAQPDRDLLLDRSAQGAHAERLRRSRRARRSVSAFADHYRQIAKPFEWTFTRADLDRLLARIAAHQPQLRSPPDATPPTAPRPAFARRRRARRPTRSHSPTTTAATRWPDRSTRPPPTADRTCPHRASRSPPAQAARAPTACRVRQAPRREHHLASELVILGDRLYTTAPMPPRATSAARPATTDPDTADPPTQRATSRTRARSQPPLAPQPPAPHPARTPAPSSPPTAHGRPRSSA